MKTQAETIMEGIQSDAIAWALENGLREPIEISSSEVLDFGFKIKLVEKETNGIATCTFRSDGRRSMYELDKRGGSNKCR